MQTERVAAVARSERAARHVGFWWGFAEGTAFFIVPDVYISFATLFSIRAGAVAWGFSVLGSLAAIPLIYGVAIVLGLDYLALLDAIPGISATMVQEVTAKLETGLPYTPLLVLGGVPLKVYGGVAFSLGVPLGAVLAWTVFARIVRIAPTYLVMSGVRAFARRHIDARPLAWTAVLVAFWVGFYALYFVAMGRA